MDAEDLGDGWEPAAGVRAGNDRLRWGTQCLVIGRLLARRAGLSDGEKADIRINRGEGRIALIRADDESALANNLMSAGKSGTLRLSAKAAERMAGVEPPLVLEVEHVEDGCIIASYE